MLSHLGNRGLIVGPGTFRIILALMVFVSHTTRLNIGVLGVMLFFMLSGYWVTSIWRERFSGHNVLWFYASRYFRIIPVYLLVAIPAAIALDRPLLPNILLFGIATNNEADALTISWSLDIELQFYLILPLLLTAFSRVSKVMVAASIGAAACAWALRSEIELVTVFQYLPAFLIGAYFYDNRVHVSKRAAHISAALFVLVSAVLAVLPATAPFLLKTTILPEGTAVFSMVWMLFLVPYVMASLEIQSTPLDRHLGNISYPFYLVHTIVLYAMTMLLGGMERKVAALITTSALALMIYVVADRPIEKLRNRYLSPGNKAKARSVPDPALSRLP
ncbi:acyltransferase family protein [Aurantiacibacter marinus]|nr:acyltransferase [Aurantiacibacter marinus]